MMTPLVMSIYSDLVVWSAPDLFYIPPENILCGWGEEIEHFSTERLSDIYTNLYRQTVRLRSCFSRRTKPIARSATCSVYRWWSVTTHWPFIFQILFHVVYHDGWNLHRVWRLLFSGSFRHSRTLVVFVFLCWTNEWLNHQTMTKGQNQ